MSTSPSASALKNSDTRVAWESSSSRNSSSASISKPFLHSAPPFDPLRQASRLPIKVLKMLTARSGHILHPEYLQPLPSTPVSPIEVRGRFFFGFVFFPNSYCLCYYSVRWTSASCDNIYRLPVAVIRSHVLPRLFKVIICCTKSRNLFVAIDTILVLSAQVPCVIKPPVRCRLDCQNSLLNAYSRAVCVFFFLFSVITK